MPFPIGLATKTLTFGRYSNALGVNQGGTVKVGFDRPMLYVPTGEVIVSGEDSKAIEGGSGVGQVVVPVTVTPDLVADWDTGAPSVNQRIKITVSLPGYPSGSRYLDIHPDDPLVMDYDQLIPYTLPGGTPVSRATVSSVAGLTGDVSVGDLSAALGHPGTPGAGLRMVAPDGTPYLLVVDNAGVLSVIPEV